MGAAAIKGGGSHSIMEVISSKPGNYVPKSARGSESMGSAPNLALRLSEHAFAKEVQVNPANICRLISLSLM